MSPSLLRGKRAICQGESPAVLLLRRRRRAPRPGRDGWRAGRRADDPHQGELRGKPARGAVERRGLALPALAGGARRLLRFEPGDHRQRADRQLGRYGRVEPRLHRSPPAPACAPTSPKSKLLFTAHALPEYVWWQDSEDKRHLNGRYGAALFGYFNRLRFELSGRRIEQQGFFSRELEQLTSTRQLVSRLQVEVDLARGITLYSYATATSFEGNEDDFTIFRSLDRDDRALGLGLRLYSPRGWSAHLAFEDNSSDFDDAARDLSNDGTKVEVGLGYQRRRFDARLTLRFEELEPTGASLLVPYSQAGGSFQLLYQPSEKLELAAYGSRTFGYSIDTDYSHYISELYGLRGRLKSKRGGLGVFAGVGQDEFVGLAGDPGRVDDVTEIGAQLDFRLRRLFLLAVNVLRRDYDSNDDFYDRDVTSFGLSVQLGELAERLRVGSDRSAW